MEVNYVVSIWKKHGPYKDKPLRLGGNLEKSLALFNKYKANPDTAWMILSLDLKFFQAKITPEEKAEKAERLAREWE